jgi:uroporphyrinogen-III synthase
MTTRRSVWITRAQPGASRSAQSVQALGWRSLIAPLLVISPLDADMDLQPGEALAFTSAEGVRRTAALTPVRDAAVFAVGDMTAAEARRLGFSRVSSAAGDVGALTELILAAQPAAVLHPCALETAGDLVGGLRAQGAAARRLPVYRSDEAQELDAAVVSELLAGSLGALLLHSPKAARAASRLLSEGCFDLAGITAAGLSPACVEPLLSLGLLHACSAAELTEAGLLEALGPEADR